jgi:phage-related protein
MKSKDAEKYIEYALIGFGLFLVYEVFQGISAGFNSAGNTLEAFDEGVQNAVDGIGNAISTGVQGVENLF